MQPMQSRRHLKSGPMAILLPDSFYTRKCDNMRWFKRGYQYGDFEHGDTFSVPDKDL